MAKQTFEMTFAGRPLVVEVGQVAKQCNGLGKIVATL